MSIFLKRDDLVAVSLENDLGNVVWIRRKMDVGTTNRVQDALMSIQNVASDGSYSGVNINVGRQNTILLQANIVKWEGPKFRDDVTGMPVPCTPANIEMMDPDDELVDAVLARINEQNTKKKVVGEDGKPVDPLGSTTPESKSGDTGSTPSTKP